MDTSNIVVGQPVVALSGRQIGRVVGTSDYCLVVEAEGTRHAVRLDAVYLVERVVTLICEANGLNRYEIPSAQASAANPPV